MSDNTTNRSPDEIERDIRATQDEMSRTAEQLGEELNGRNIVKSLVDKAGQNGFDMRYMMDAAQRNPLALGLIAVGGLWLISGRDYKLSARTKSKDQASSETDLYASSANFSQSGNSAADETADLSGHSRARVQQVTTKAKSLYFDSPLVSGLAAAIAGAIAGSAIPATRTEGNYVGAMGEKVLGNAQTKLKQTGGEARKMADQLLDKVDQTINRSLSEDTQAGQLHTA